MKAYGWEFCYDREVTEKYYENYNDLCQCAYCRNVYKNLGAMPENVRIFMEQFGIDLSKPIDQFATEADKQTNTVENFLYYAVHGEAKASVRQNIYIDDICIEIVPREHSPYTDILEPFFVMQICAIWLPWTLEDSIDEF